VAAAEIPNFAAGGGLLPAIAQDARTGEVLMLAWMNREAFDETLATGRAVYYSRSRQRLWRKGEESGHMQKLIDIRVDCDADAILLRVEQLGAACHEGYSSCFFRSVAQDGSTAVVLERLVDPAAVYKTSPPAAGDTAAGAAAG
jgi:phosphoribosyl-AMP cyclohydrolase